MRGPGAYALLFTEPIVDREHHTPSPSPKLRKQKHIFDGDYHLKIVTLSNTSQNFSEFWTLRRKLGIVSR